jgi:putative heme-binding domain-containing protein
MACASLFAQSPRDLYLAHCAGCHGPSGEGSRGPALRTAAPGRPNDAASMVALLRRGVPGTEMPAFAPQTIADEPLRGLAAYVLGLRTTPRDAASGQLDRGAELFRTKGKCLNCHRVNGEGRTSGPDLSDIGRLRQTGWLRRAVTDPETAIYDSFDGYRWTILIPDNYLLVDARTRNGDRITGSRMNEDAFSIQIRDGDGRIRSLLKSDIAELRKEWGKSPMPPFRDTFTSGELDDLVAYLASLRGSR